MTQNPKNPILATQRYKGTSLQILSIEGETYGH